MKKKILLHVGCTKTATTTLQNNVLYELHKKGKINFLGRYVFNGFHNYPLNNLLSKLIKLNDNEFLKISPELKRELDSLTKKEYINVISEESLLIYYKKWDRNIKRNLKRFALLLDDYEVEIMITLRRQYDLFYSFYVQFYQTAFHCDRDFNSFDKYLKTLREDPEIYFMYDFYNITNTINEYFGNSDIEIMFYEDYIYNFNEITESLSSLLDVSANIIFSLFTNFKHENVKKKDERGYKTESVKLGPKISNFIEKLKEHTMIKYFYYKIYKNSELLKRVYLIFRSINLKRSKLIKYLNEKQKNELFEHFKSSNEKLCKKYPSLHNKMKKYNYL